MRQDRIHPSFFHGGGCTCPHCAPAPAEPAAAPAFSLSANAIALRVLAGMAVGEALAWILDRTVDGPGLLALFGF